MSEILHRLASGARRGARLLLLLLVCAGAANNAAAAEPEVQNLQLYIGESVRIETGFGARLLNLDPELVKISTQEPGTIALEGLKYGTATVWIWGTSGTTVVRIRILGYRAAAPAVGARAAHAEAAQPFSLRHDFRYFGYRTSGLRSDQDDIGAYDLEARMIHPSFRAQGRMWMETRDGEVDVPQYDILLERENGSPVGHALLHLGTVRTDWSQFTFYRDRIRGARLELRSSPGERRRSDLLLELAYGKDIPDYVVLGSRSVVNSATEAHLGGGRLRWRPFAGLTTTAEIGVNRDRDGDSHSVTALGASGRAASFGYNGVWAHDGENWATQGTVRWSARRTTTVSLGGKYLEGLFRTLHGGRGLPGSRYVNFGIDHTVARRLRLSGESSWRRWERIPPDTTVTSPIGEPLLEEQSSWRDNRHHSLRATYRLGAHFRASGWFRLDDNGTWDIHWRRQRAGLEVSASGLEFVRGRGPRFGVKLGSENSNERASSILKGRYAWQSVYIQPELTVSDCLGANFRLEGRFADELAPDDPSELIWRSHAYACVPPFSVLRGGMLTAGFRKWEYLSSYDGLYVSGRHLSARLELGSRPFFGLALELLGTWEQDIDLDVTNTSIQLALSHKVGTNGRSTPGGASHKGTIRGCVFHDRNENGQRDANERGLRNVRVRLHDGREAVTDDKGCYRFRGVWGQHAFVRIMTESVAQEYATTTPVVQRVDIAEARRFRADFGLGPAPPTIEVLAFNDLNGNTRYDADEPLVPGVVIHLSELDVQLGTTADRAVRQQLPRDRPFAGEWSHRSLPAGYSPGGDWKTVTPRRETGRLTRLELPLQALRSIRGQVFLDVNRNGLRDRGERAIEGAVLRARERFTVTDDKGRYLLKALAAGEIAITLTADSVPEGWMLPQPRRVTLPAGPVSLENVNVPLHPLR